MSRITAISFSCMLIFGFALASEAGPDSATEATAEFIDARHHARGPGTLFDSIEAAVIDALAYSYQQALDTCESEIMRGGTIYRVDEDGFSYEDIHRATRSTPHRIRYALKPEDVARFHLYPPDSSASINRLNERPSRSDLRSVAVTDPIHRPLYILHPSMAIRAYHGEGTEFIAVAKLRDSPRVARKCPAHSPSMVSSNSRAPSPSVSSSREPSVRAPI